MRNSLNFQLLQLLWSISSHAKQHFSSIIVKVNQIKKRRDSFLHGEVQISAEKCSFGPKSHNKSCASLIKSFLRFLVIGSEMRSRFDCLYYVDGFMSYYSSYLHNPNVKPFPSLKSFISLKMYWFNELHILYMALMKLFSSALHLQA